jgi:hypothetical protein
LFPDVARIYNNQVSASRKSKNSALNQKQSLLMAEMKIKKSDLSNKIVKTLNSNRASQKQLTKPKSSPTRVDQPRKHSNLVACEPNENSCMNGGRCYKKKILDGEIVLLDTQICM